MEISEIIMETFTLGTAIGLNMTHNASFWAESVNAAAWNRARLVEAKLSCFCWCINALMKSTRLESFQRDQEKKVCMVHQRSKYLEVFCLTETGKEQYIRRELPTLCFEFNWKKNPLCQTCEDKHWQSNCQDIQWGSSFP